MSNLKPIVVALVAILLAACESTGMIAPANENSVTPVTLVDGGFIQGEVVTDGGDSLHIFKGVPYAAPPVGDLRWQAPAPVVSWDGVRRTTAWSNRCPQPRSSMMGAGGMGFSEDCLYLNVVTPAASVLDNLPVMVFFHGGGLTSGTGNSDVYNNTALPRKGVVVVTVNSRLGPIGYMAHPALTKESGRNASGNYGTLDLIASLRWVQRNIRQFGGDPDNVLIFGESGGGTKTISLMTSPLAYGLFHKAIVESGSASTLPERTTTLETAEARGEKIAEALGLGESDAVLDGMREAAWEDVISAATETEFYASTTVDGYVLPMSVNEMLKAGKQHDVPLIVGANEGERREMERTVPTLANLMSETASSDVFVYNFTHVPQGWRDIGCVAFHGIELAYVFGRIPEGLTVPTMLFLGSRSGCKSPDPGTTEADLVVADKTMELWAQFARTGNPSVPTIVDWPAYTPKNDLYLDIGIEPAVKQGVKTSWKPLPIEDDS